MLWLALVSLASAEEPVFTPEIQVRPRVEAHSGRDGVTHTDDLFASQRARLGGKLVLGPVTAHAVVQDVRVWGEEQNTLRDWTADGLDMHVAEIVWKPSDNLALTVGRQEWTIHEHRLVGNVDWTQQGRSFDGVKLWGKAGDLSMDLGAAVLASATGAANAALGRDKDACVGLLRAGWAPMDGPLVDVLYVLDTDGTTELMRHTGGVYTRVGAGIVTGRIEAYYQAGSQTVLDEKTEFSAYMAGVSATIAPETSVKPTLTLWYDLLSGDDDLTDDTATAFNTLFATNHKFYGQIDMVNFGVAGQADGRGLHDAALKLGLTPVERLSVNLDAHLFMAAADQGGDGMLGQEVDLWAGAKLAPKLNLGFGGAVFLPSYNASRDMWGWVSLDAKL